jgi:uncharacterized Zn finger protein
MPPRATFGTTWWGTAWIDALDASASLDPSRLGRGRTYARNGSVGPLSLAAGHVSAKVTGKHHRYYRVDVAVRTLAPSEQEQVVDAIAGRAAHAAALLDGDMDPGILDDLAAVDVRLLPGAGDLRTDCSCPDWAEPCKHSAAVCYLVANELDRDPFVLFLLRGMHRDDLMEQVRARRAATSGSAAPASSPAVGIPAREAWDHLPLDAALPPLPEVVARREPLSTSHRPVHTPWDAAIPPQHGIDPRRVDELAADAAQRAQEVLVDGRPTGLRSGSRADLARRAARLDRGPQLSRLAAQAGVTVRTLRSWSEAWVVAGDAGVAVVADGNAWSTDQEALEAGRTALVDLGYLRRSVALSYDSLKVKGEWLVIGPDERWYRLRGGGKHSELKLMAPPADDVCDLVDPPDVRDPT